MTFRPALRLSLLALALVSVAGCAGPPNQGAVAPAATGPDKTADAGGGGTGAATGALGAGALTDPARLKGLSSVQVKSALGDPGFRRRDAPGEVWQYRGGRCILDLFLYDETGGQTVEYYSVRSARPIADKECLTDLLHQRSATPSS